MTRAGLGFAGTPAIGTPDAHSMPSNTSASVPPHCPRTRTGRTFARQSTPAIPCPLLVLAAISPATKVPCHDDGVAG